MKRLVLLAFSVSLLSCTHQSHRSLQSDGATDDPHIWLEEIEGEKTIAWAKERTRETFTVLKDNRRFKKIEREIRKIALAKDRIPIVSIRGGKLYNFWQDAENVRGLWRRTTINSYKEKSPNWETLLDLDKLAQEEKENWVYKGASCLPPSYGRCLISLSKGGKDAVVVREFDVGTKTFVKDGFYLAEAKNRTSWIDENTIYVGTDWGPGTMSKSGYPITAREWKRGTKLEEAREVFRGEVNDVGAGSYTDITPEAVHRFHYRNLTFFTAEYFYESPAGERIKMSMPESADFQGTFGNLVIWILRDELQVKSKKFPQGSLVGIPLEKLSLGEGALNFIQTLFTPTEKKFLSGGASVTKNRLFIEVLDDVKGRIVELVPNGGDTWREEDYPIRGNGVATFTSVDGFSEEFLTSYTDFLTPTSIYHNSESKKPTILKQSPARFKSKGLITEQKFATSKDGTKVPYFIVRKKTMKFNGKNPTLLYGYGGFEISNTPFYLSSIGKVWVERGGVYVLSNIRGGGEYGPAWHQAALKQNRQKAFDDFIAIAEDLIKNKVTSPRHLGIQGGSNGGLLVGSVFVQRPDLFNAVLCEVPLLDMMRFHKLLAGASWMGEYGNPEVAEEREAILQYSPYQNLKPDRKYPKVLFFTSTKDDRVHPGHARKMVARMREFGHPVFYYENTEGGHGGAANIEQKILLNSIEYSYLWKMLGGWSEGVKDLFR